MGLKNDIDPWERIKQLESENAELRSEMQAAHNALDAAGADEGHAIKEITEGEQKVNYSLDARIIRYLLEHACPLGKIRR
jgi:multidrug resistance efflux pump